MEHEVAEECERYASPPSMSDTRSHEACAACRESEDTDWRADGRQARQGLASRGLLAGNESAAGGASEVYVKPFTLPRASPSALAFVGQARAPSGATRRAETYFLNSSAIAVSSAPAPAPSTMTGTATAPPNAATPAIGEAKDKIRPKPAPPMTPRMELDRSSQQCLRTSVSKWVNNGAVTPSSLVMRTT